MQRERREEGETGGKGNTGEEGGSSFGLLRLKKSLRGAMIPFQRRMRRLPPLCPPAAPLSSFLNTHTHTHTHTHKEEERTTDSGQERLGGLVAPPSFRQRCCRSLQILHLSVNSHLPPPLYQNLVHVRNDLGNLLKSRGRLAEAKACYSGR